MYLYSLFIYIDLDVPDVIYLWLTMCFVYGERWLFYYLL